MFNFAPSQQTVCQNNPPHAAMRCREQSLTYFVGYMVWPSYCFCWSHLPKIGPRGWVQNHTRLAQANTWLILNSWLVGRDIRDSFRPALCLLQYIALIGFLHCVSIFFLKWRRLERNLVLWKSLASIGERRNFAIDAEFAVARLPLSRVALWVQ